jgi:hypothetical protein
MKNIPTIVTISSLVLLAGCAELEKTIQTQTETLTKTTSERTVENSPADANTKYILKQIIVKLNNGQTCGEASNVNGQTFGVSGLVNLDGSSVPYMTLNQIKTLADKNNVDVPLDRYQNLMQK